MRRSQVHTHTLLRHGCNALCTEGKCSDQVQWRNKRTSSRSCHGVRRIQVQTKTLLR